MEEPFMREKNEVLQKIWLACIYNLTCERLLQAFTGEINGELGKEELAILQRMQSIPVRSVPESLGIVKVDLETLKGINTEYESWQSFEDFCGEIH